MKQIEFERFTQQFIDDMLNIMSKKNPDYSTGTGNPLHDYYSTGLKYNISPLQAWAVLLDKHLHAIERYVKYKNVCSEPIRSRMLDAANYIVLGAALIEELERTGDLRDDITVQPSR